MAGQPPLTTQVEQVFPYQRPPLETLYQIPGVISPLVIDTEGFVVNRQHGVNQGNGVPPHQDKAVGEALAGIANIPAHGTRKRINHKHVDLGAGAAGVAALAMVEHDINALIYQVFDNLVV